MKSHHYEIARQGLFLAVLNNESKVQSGSQLVLDANAWSMLPSYPDIRRTHEEELRYALDTHITSSADDSAYIDELIKV